jgi:acyl-CoA thioester hydrolase
MSAAPFTHELRVRYGECDPQGIVFNANYLLFCDVAVTELWRAAVGGWNAMVVRGVEVVLAEASVRFRAPARFDDVLALAVRVPHLGRTSIGLEIDIARDGETLATCAMRQVCVDGTSYAKTEMPPWLREGLARFA